MATTGQKELLKSLGSGKISVLTSEELEQHFFCKKKDSNARFDKLVVPQSEFAGKKPQVFVASKTIRVTDTEKDTLYYPLAYLVKCTNFIATIMFKAKNTHLPPPVMVVNRYSSNKQLAIIMGDEIQIIITDITKPRSSRKKRAAVSYAYTVTKNNNTKKNVVKGVILITP
ncbi:MAG: hypothetical protein WCF93_00165 [Candidatus Moraniibacteriota bacterium]